MEKISLILVVALFIYCEGQLDRRTPPKDLTIDQIMSRMLGGYGAIANRLTLPGGLVLKELDMYVTQEQFNALNSNSKRKRRKAVRNPVSYWDGGRVPYRFTPGHFDDGDQYFVKVAMRELEKYTCLRFKERTTETDYVDMMDSQGCWSRLGKEGGRQELSLDRNGCRFKGLYLHEIGHAVGLIHEQNRPDRDGYIRINEQNIQPGLKDQFNKYPVSYINTYAIPYDFPSVMHYGVTAFSRDGRSQTISALPAYKDKEAEIGRVYQKELSFGDVRVLNAMYRCNDHCDDSVRCDGGFLDQNCECICPDGTSDCMIGKTKLNPDQENVCENVYDDDTCNEWRDNGDCVVAEDWMRQNCKMSCNYCSKSNPRPNTNCMNAYSDDTKCRGWALEGECVINPAWMPINCASDCHSCKNNGSIPDEGTKTTRTPTQTRPPVVTTPPPTTPPPDSCEDRYPTSGCQRFQSRWNYCTIYKMWMDANCMKTCELCSGGKREKELDSCKDENRYCPDWARRGDCVFNPSYMLSNCKKSCRVCTSGLREGSDELVQQLMAENGSTRSAVSQLSILIAICTVAVLV
ncbi:zinc metalloproteinase nas-13-like isoform X2 [Ostrea edulis]|uniref:zinc metalloproteinase nas-13-like isoform X2 n=1 Tax=Ostrea edulis TaxID=37623 RepID=UPI0024AEC394|nr:zinc metalloproteinase nas-13-like isoform X2 [Ostrea edulis]